MSTHDLCPMSLCTMLCVRRCAILNGATYAGPYKQGYNVIHVTLRVKMCTAPCPMMRERTQPCFLPRGSIYIQFTTLCIWLKLTLLGSKVSNNTQTHGIQLCRWHDIPYTQPIVVNLWRSQRTRNQLCTREMILTERPISLDFHCMGERLR